MSKGYYEKSCDDFALYSSPWMEHSENYGSDDYHSEFWASEKAEMEAEGLNVEYEMIIDYMSSDEFVGPLPEGWL